MMSSKIGCVAIAPYHSHEVREVIELCIDRLYYGQSKFPGGTVGQPRGSGQIGSGAPSKDVECTAADPMEIASPNSSPIPKITFFIAFPPWNAEYSRRQKGYKITTNCYGYRKGKWIVPCSPIGRL